MKNFISCLLLAGTVLYGCDNNDRTDPVKEAKEENKEIINHDSSYEHHDSATAVLQPTKDDAGFLVDAAAGGMMEVELGALAQKNTQNKRVKAFGAMMMKDHKAMGEKIKALARAKNLTLPDSISNKQKDEKDRLAKKEGSEFDKAYMDMMVDDHQEDIKDFEKAATDATNPAVRSFAADQLKILHVHLDSARNVQKVVD